jgi:hypothetical protein
MKEWGMQGLHRLLFERFIRLFRPAQLLEFRISSCSRLAILLLCVLLATTGCSSAMPSEVAATQPIAIGETATHEPAATGVIETASIPSPLTNTHLPGGPDALSGLEKRAEVSIEDIPPDLSEEMRYTLLDEAALATFTAENVIAHMQAVNASLQNSDIDGYTLELVEYLGVAGEYAWAIVAQDAGGYWQTARPDGALTWYPSDITADHHWVRADDGLGINVNRNFEFLEGQWVVVARQEPDGQAVAVVNESGVVSYHPDYVLTLTLPDGSEVALLTRGLPVTVQEQAVQGFGAGDLGLALVDATDSLLGVWRDGAFVPAGNGAIVDEAGVIWTWNSQARAFERGPQAGEVKELDGDVFQLSTEGEWEKLAWPEGIDSSVISMSVENNRPVLQIFEANGNPITFAERVDGEWQLVPFTINIPPDEFALAREIYTKGGYVVERSEV